MSWWITVKRLLFGAPPKAIEHPYFGSIKEVYTFYSGECYFPPLKSTVGYHFDSVSPEDLLLQEDFHRWVIENYEIILNNILNEFEKVRKDWDLPPKTAPTRETLILETIGIPATAPGSDVEWDITYFAENELQHWMCCQMIGTNLEEYTIDG